MKYSIEAGRLHTYGLEIRATEHCNLRCQGCSQNSPYMPPSSPDLSRLRKSLAALERILHADRATILGGEPLLNSDILELLAIVKASRVFNRIFVTTNGLLLQRMHPEFWRLTDVVEISIYPTTRSRIQRNLDKILDMAFRYDVEVHLLACSTFKHIGLSTPISPSSLVPKIYQACYFKQFCHTLHGERFYKCAPCINVGARLSQHDVARVEDDGIPVDNSPEMLDRLIAYLKSDIPLTACDFCLGSSGSAFPHRQLTDSDDHVESFANNLIADEFWSSLSDLVASDQTPMGTDI